MEESLSRREQVIYTYVGIDIELVSVRCGLPSHVVLVQLLVVTKVER